MVVDEDGSSSRWLHGVGNEEDCVADENSVASTVVAGENSIASTVVTGSRMDLILDKSQSVASTVVAGSRRELLLNKFHGIMQLWMEASVVMPSGSCVGFDMQEAALRVVCPNAHAAVPFPLSGTLLALRELDARTSELCGCSVGANRRPPRSGLSATSAASVANCTATNADGELWKKLVYHSSGLQWFRDVLGGEEAVRRLFQNAYLNIQSISKPSELAKILREADPATGDASSSEAMQQKLPKKKCAPWALVRLAESDACICCTSVMQVPFRGFKKHQRNGVVFCFFGNRVFATCMDDECRQILSRYMPVYLYVFDDIEGYCGD